MIFGAALILLLISWPGQTNAAYECENVYPRSLDIGIYWANTNDEGKLEWVKACPDTGVFPYGFDSGKKTVIWVHGLQPGFVEKNERFWVETEDMQFLAPWVMSGWNVGIFQWTQFADERLAHFERGEAKIWSGKYFADMRYKHTNARGDVVISDAPRSKSVTDLFIEHYIAHAKQILPDVEVRLIGHSLGSQLVMHAAYRLYEMQTEENIEDVRLPNRIAMLDPVYSPGTKGFLGKNHCGETLGSVMGCFAALLNEHGVAVEYYRFSFINKCIFSSQENNDLVHSSAFSQPMLTAWGDHRMGSCYDEDLLSSAGKLKENIKSLGDQMHNQHIAAVPYYALSLIHAPVRCTLVFNDTSCEPLKSLALSAAMPTEMVLHWSKPVLDNSEKACFHQFDDGARDPDAPTVTVDPGDDMFFIRTCKHAHN